MPKKEAKSLTELQTERILPLMSDTFIFLGNIPDLRNGYHARDAEALNNFWKDVASEYFPMLRDRGLHLADIRQMFKGMLTIVDGLSKETDHTITEKTEYVENALYGINAYHELTLERVEELELPLRQAEYEEARKKAGIVEN